MDHEMLLSAMQTVLAAMTRDLFVKMAHHIAHHHFALSQRYHRTTVRLDLSSFALLGDTNPNRGKEA